jgi:hypothetical protein
MSFHTHKKRKKKERKSTSTGETFFLGKLLYHCQLTTTEATVATLYQESVIIKQKPDLLFPCGGIISIHHAGL